MPSTSKPPSSKPRSRVGRGRKAKLSPLPLGLEPQLATLVKQAPGGDEWLHEIKFDGYRMLCRIDASEAKFISRGGHDWTEKFRPLADAAAKLRVRQAWLDGEVAVLDENGVTSFQALQNVLGEGHRDRLVYFVFDLLHLNGEDLTGLPLDERKARLAKLLAPKGSGRIRYSAHVIGDGPIFSREACRHGLEGIISKRRDRPYSPGRGMDWLKVKCKARAELVIGGYTDPSGPRTGFGSLLAGYYPKTVKRGTARDKQQGDGHRKLIYAGRVGTGFNSKSLETLYRRLRALEQKDSPFESVIEQGRPLYLRRGARGLHWVKPNLVCEVEFTNWTRDGLLRHPSFVGLCEDKAATEVVREKEVVL